MFEQPTIPEMPKVKEQQQAIESKLTVNGLPLTEYERLRAADRELKKLKKELASCATVNIEELEEKERKYEEYKQKITGRALGEVYKGKKPTETQQKQLDKLEQEMNDAEDAPEVIINGNRITAVVMRFAADNIPQKQREYYAYEKGLPEGSRVKIE